MKLSATALMRTLGAVIALIAVQFMSLPAQAHSGHQHGFHAHAHAAPMHHHAATADHDDRAAQPAELRSADQQPAGASEAAHSCVSGCCGSGVSCCGGTAMMVVTDPLPPLARSSSIALERTAAAGGIDPDALRKPPRSLA